MPFETVKYIPPARKEAIRQKQVTLIRAAGHARKPWGNTFTNHWCIYLETGSNSSVRIDMTPSYTVPGTVLATGTKGNMIVSELNYVVSTHAIKVIKIRPLQGLRVHHVIDAVTHAGRDKYEFDKDGVGCRKWVNDTLILLHSKNYGNLEQIQEARVSLHKLWPDGTPLELGAGAYY